MLDDFTLIVITGSTGVGKSAVAVELAGRLGCEIINADSRQVYRGIPIGTACPTAEQMRAVRHHFVACKELDESYSAAQFESDVMRLLPELAARSRYAVMCGGSMLYVHAVCNGIDAIPDITPAVRQAVKSTLAARGLEALLHELRERDPDYFAIVDRQNTQRVLHAVEVCRQTGGTFTQLRTGQAKKRPFRMVKIALNVERSTLFERINRRVDNMIAAGLEQEAWNVRNLRHLNALNTVGYKEMFAYFDGTMDFATAVERIKKHTRVYAKKQLTWHKRDESLTWCTPDDALTVALSQI